ncbi:hypothetical protein DXG03_008989 [Asterophora parasitica]|uniref:Uncharacterized protein n=1 Tax=Asterophora parasitica TaxID=117018 RepID=A0A9P7KD48_9AGAR|nr:hypothetical protein DXG03_008989 [Asterophora parasitica]
MHHRAFRLLPTTPASHASSLSFTSILQAAAGRAWLRSASSSPLSSRSPPATHDKVYKLGSQAASKRHKPLRTPPEITVVQTPKGHELSIRASVERKKARAQPTPPYTPRHSRPSRPSSVAYFNPEDVRDSDLGWPHDPARSDLDLPTYPNHYSSRSGRPWYWDDASVPGTPVRFNDSRTLATPVVPVVQTAPSLYQNLLHLIFSHDPVTPLPALLDYHDLHPGLRSTRSYNLLIFLALRSGAYGTVPWLLSSMRREAILGNLETWKLRVRWLIQSGWWDKAWNEVMTTMPRTHVLAEGQKRRYQVTNALPLSIWLEFFRSLKRGTTHQRRTRAQASSEATEDTSSSDTSPSTSESRELYLTRYHTLMNNRPTAIPDDLSQTSPRAVYSVVSIMLRLQECDKALSFTKAYFTRLPPRISASWARTCLDIIHLHIAMGFPHGGLRQLYETRRTMVSLVKLHPAFRPTSTTLFLLLAPLKDAKRCGTVALNTVRSFKSRWGAGTEDRRVRRRVATLALKEGRTDIVGAILRAEGTSRWANATWRLMRQAVGGAAVPRPRRLLRPPARRLFKRNGREERYWCGLMRRLSRKRRRDRRK